MIQITNEHVRALINPLGAELIFLSKINGENVLWDKDENFWNRISPNLFPIVGRLKNDTFFYQEKKYSITQHGFARDYMFEVVEQSESFVLLRLKSDDKLKKHYPFEFIFDVHYRLNEAEIEVKYLIQNRGEEILPYSVGGHPGFSIKGDFKDYSLDFGKKISTKQWLLEGPFYSGKTNPLIIENELKLDYKLFENDAIVIRNPEFNQVVLSHKEKGKIIGLSSETLNAIGFWTKENAPFLCIEPWWGWADSQESNGNILDKEGIHILKKQESKSHSYKIQLY